MKDRKRPSKKATLSVVIAATALTSLLCAVYISGGDARAAAHLLQITNDITLGHTTRDQFLVLSEPYQRYLLRDRTAKSSETSGIMDYRFHGYLRTPIVMSISISFSSNVIVGRDVGVLRGDCCSVETRQRLEGPMNSIFGTHRVLREIIGDHQFVKFEVAPGISGQALSDIFDYRTECLLPFHSCNSVEKINPQAIILLRESLSAGY